MNTYPADSSPPVAGETNPELDTRALRRYFARHNRQALLLAFLSLTAATLLWAVVYLFVYWFSLMAATLSYSFDIKTVDRISQPGLVSRYFPWWFAAGAGASLIVAGLLRHRVRTEKLREERLYLLWMFAELLLALPNVTFSIWGNLMAVCHLRASELAEAGWLLQRINASGGRLSVGSLPLEVDDERTLHRVVFALQLVGLVAMHENERGWYLCLRNRDALALLRQPASAR